jgi:hypothetical protein
LPSLDLPADVPFEEDEDGDEDAPFEKVVSEEELLGFAVAFDAFGGDVFVFTVVVVVPAVVVAAADAGTACSVLAAAAAAFFAWPDASAPGLTAPALPRPLPGLDVAAGASTAIAHAAISAAARAWARDGAALLLLCVDPCASMTS